MCYSPGHVRYGFCLQTYHIWIVTHLCSFVAIFAFKLHFPCMSRTKNRKNKVFWVAFLLLLTVSLSQRSYTSLFQHVKLCVTIYRRTAILPQTQICKFGRTKFDTHTVLSPDEVLISLIVLLQVLLSSWRSARKVRLCLLRDLAFPLQNCRIQQKLHEMHKICLWLEPIRSSHKEFAYLLYNKWNSQNLAS